MSLLQRVLQKIVFPKSDPNRLAGRSSGFLPTSKEVRYKALQKIFGLLVTEVNFELMTQKVADVMVEEMDFLGGVLFLPDENNRELVAWTYTQSFLGKTVVTWLQKPFREHRYSLDLKNNLMVDSYLTGNRNITRRMSEMISPAVPEGLSDRMQRFMGMKLCTTLPIKFRGETLGVLFLTSVREETSQEELEMLETLANQVAIALQNAKLFQKNHEQLTKLTISGKQQKIIFRITNQLVSVLDPKEVAIQTVDFIPQETGYFGAILSLHNTENNTLVAEAVTHTEFEDRIMKVLGKSYSDFPGYLDNAEHDSKLMEAFKNDKITITNNLEDAFSPALPRRYVKPLQALLKVKSVISLPVKSRGKKIGAISFVLTDKSPDQLGENDIGLMQVVANQVGLALDNAFLYSQVQNYVEQLQKTNTALETALSQIQESRRKEHDMLDVMGHELRTPLTVVRNALSVLETDSTKGEIDKEKVTKYISMALESARREVRLVETLLSATKVDASRLQLDMTKISVNDVILNGVESQKNFIADKGLKLVHTPLSSDQFIFADRVRIQEIMDNFLSNAAKYTPQGEIKVNAWQAANKVWIQVSDTGMGIDETDLKNLGKKFFRARQHIQGKDVVRPGGTGLGLFVTFELIRMMGGQLYIQSKVGEGTSFTFGLPAYAGQSEHQFDQTFEAGQVDDRQHIFLNQEPPKA